MVLAAGLIMLAPAINAQSNNGNARAAQRQKNVETWKQDMANFREKIHEDHQMNELADSIASIQAIAAIRKLSTSELSATCVERGEPSITTP